MNKLSALAGRAAALFFPGRCAFCGRIVPDGRSACEVCEKSLPVLRGARCPRCGRELLFCTCGKQNYEFDRCVSPFYYEGVAKQGVLRLKYGGRRSAAGVLGRACAGVAAQAYEGIRFDFVTAVPLSRKELGNRGFNQSELIARAVARSMGLRYRNVLSKPADTKPQHSCAAHERWGNVFGAYTAIRRIDGQTVLLVDDIVTTGATLSECARALRLCGAKQVCCAAAACVRKTLRAAR